MTLEQFYQAVGQLLGAPHQHSDPPTGNMRKRWGPREPGNGRYAGHGIVRVFAADRVHVALYAPRCNGWFGGMAEALVAITEAK